MSNPGNICKIQYNDDKKIQISHQQRHWMNFLLEILGVSTILHISEKNNWSIPKNSTEKLEFDKNEKLH